MMEIVYKNVKEVIPYKGNPRKNDRSVEAVAQSIKEFGFKVPIVIDKEGIIVAGHTRLKAAKKLGLTEVPCIIADDLTEDQIRAFRLADNKVGEKSTWEKDLLSLELMGIELDMSVFGDWGLKDEEDEEAEMPFTEVLGEEHNFIVLYFDNDIDWLQASSLLELQTVKQLSTRKDGVITKSAQRSGVGHVVNGAKAIKKIQGGG